MELTLPPNFGNNNVRRRALTERSMHPCLESEDSSLLDLDDAIRHRVEDPATEPGGEQDFPWGQ